MEFDAYLTQQRGHLWCIFVWARHFPVLTGVREKRQVDQKKKIKIKKRDLGWYKIIISKYSCLWCEPASAWELFADFSECTRDSLKQMPTHTHTHTHTHAHTQVPLLAAVIITQLVSMRRNALLWWQTQTVLMNRASVCLIYYCNGCDVLEKIDGTLLRFNVKSCN